MQRTGRRQLRRHRSRHRPPPIDRCQPQRPSRRRNRHRKSTKCQRRTMPAKTVSVGRSYARTRQALDHTIPHCRWPMSRCVRGRSHCRILRGVLDHRRSVQIRLQVLRLARHLSRRQNAGRSAHSERTVVGPVDEQSHESAVEADENVDGAIADAGRPTEADQSDYEQPLDAAADADARVSGNEQLGWRHQSASVRR